MRIDRTVRANQLSGSVNHFFELSGKKILQLSKNWRPTDGSPVFTIKGKYASRGWTEWTQGFQFGCQILQFDATGDEQFLQLGRDNTIQYMAPHVSHIGVHDHGFNNVSTYGNLRRLALEKRSSDSEDMLRFYELALKISGAVQAARWSRTSNGTGYIHSFNGPHSLFCDTVRSCRALTLSHLLGHSLMGENDQKISLLGRAVEHMTNTSRYNVFFDEGRDLYDVRGRVAHESIFNMKDGNYRCPSTQQGYSPFSTWTRGLAWIITGFAEELECFRAMPDSEFEPFGDRKAIEAMMLKTAQATADFYIENSALDGIPYWDTGAPGLASLSGWRSRPAQPDNEFEPVDSSAAAIAAQGLLRLGRYLGEKSAGKRYWQAGLTVARTLYALPYISEDTRHHGLILHSVYHRPNNWDYIPKGKSIPMGESSMWGDYHAMELALYLKRIIEKAAYLSFF